MNQLQKLKEIAGQENKRKKHELYIKGHDLTFWSTPLKISEWTLAKQQSKNPEDVLESTARLFIRKACDESGTPQYQVDALPVLMKVLSLQTASKIPGAMNNNDEEDAIELDFKALTATTRSGCCTSCTSPKSWG